RARRSRSHEGARRAPEEPAPQPQAGGDLLEADRLHPGARRPARARAPRRLRARQGAQEDSLVSGFVDAGAGAPPDEADFAIVGSGAGGGAAARALARAGRSVIVLEEGPLVTAAEAGTLIQPSMARLFRNQGKQAAFGRAATPILQGRCVGGTTFVNSA